MYGLRRTVEPASEPVTLTEAKNHLRVTGDDDDDLIEGMIAAAREYFEDRTNRSIITSTWVLTLDRWFASDEPSKTFLNLPRSPLASVSSVYYVDTAGDSTLWASSNYDVDTASLPGRLGLAYGCNWPATREKMNAITITYTAGVASASLVPEGIKRAILIILGDLYINRESFTTGTIRTPLVEDRFIIPWIVGDGYFEFGGVE